MDHRHMEEFGGSLSARVFTPLEERSWDVQYQNPQPLQINKITTITFYMRLEASHHNGYENNSGGNND